MALLLEISWQGVGTGLGMPRPEEAQMGEKPKSKVPATSHSRPGFAALPAVVPGALMGSSSGVGALHCATLGWTDRSTGLGSG